MIKKLPREIPSYVMAVATFAALHFALTVLANHLATRPSDFASFSPWLDVAAYLFYVIAGLVAGALIKRRQIISGAIVGALAAVTAVVLFGVSSNNAFGIVTLLANGVVLGAVGGTCALVLGRKKSAL